MAARLAQGSPTGAGRTVRLSGLVETAGYLGAALVAAAVALLGDALWESLAHWAQTTLLVLIAVTLWVAGRWARPPGTVGAADRLAGFLWTLSTAAAAATAAAVVEWVDFPESPRVVVVGLVALVVAALLWRARSAALQLVTLFVGAAVTTSGLLVALEVAELWAWSLLVTAFGAAWTALVWGRLLQPAGTGYLLGAATIAVGPQIAAVEASTAGPATGVVIAVALIGASFVVARSSLTVVGTIAATVYLLQLAHRVLPGQLGWMVGMLAAGAGLLAGSLATLRTARPRQPAEGASSDE